MKKHKQRPWVALVLNLLICFILFVSSVMVLAYAMTKNDMPVTAYRTAYIVICAAVTLIASFINAKRMKLNPFILIAISAVFFTAVAVVPVLAVSGNKTGLSVLFIPAASIVSAFIGTVIGKKI